MIHGSTETAIHGLCRATRPERSASRPAPGRCSVRVFMPMAVMALFVISMTSGAAWADEFYRVTAFEIEYEEAVPGLPEPDEILAEAPVLLTPSDEGWLRPDPEDEVVEIRLAEVAEFDEAQQRFSGEALRAVSTQLLNYMVAQDIMGVVVLPDPVDIHPETWQDRRRDDRTALRMLIIVARVGDVRTIGSGERVPDAERIDHPAHARIRRLAPVQAGDRPLRRSEIATYMHHLNRHPGRRVDVAVSEGEADDEVILDLMVAENRPWMLFAQASNTGTEATTKWRQRFGFAHNQLTGRDDILNVQYITGNFDEVHSVMGFYDTPVGDLDWLRFEFSGSWGEFDASEVGLAGEPFEGEQWMIGAELAATVLRHREMFVDLFAGAQWHHLRVENPFALPAVGEDDLFMPHIGARLERRTRTTSLNAEVRTSFNLPGVANTEDEPGRLQSLGRLDPDRNFTILSWDGRYEFYLDPIFHPDSWEDPDSPHATLAHRMLFRLGGQTAFDRRLVAQQQRVAGGLHSVRGYPESVVAGDTALIASAEYNFHLPRMLQRDPEPGELFGQPFRRVPDQPYGRADWDLIFRTFIDGGWTWQSDRRDFERNQSLLGTGVGLELMILQNASLRADWGVALLDVDDAFGRSMVTSGSNRFHLQFTLFY